VFLAGLGILAMPPRAAEMREGSRDIRIVVRNMTFYLEGSSEANPTLRLRAGERVRLVLRNEDRGMLHDFTVPAWSAATPLIQGPLETEVAITAPARGASTTYACTPHGQMMRGTIIVE
jgi:FtsP/CotA-like multicopper oxidase with cupredoxin domain